jgi:hypothetical protein
MTKPTIALAVPLIFLLATAGCQRQPAHDGSYYPQQPRQQQAACYHPEPPSAAEAQMAAQASDPSNPNAFPLMMMYQSQRQERERTCP